MFAQDILDQVLPGLTPHRVNAVYQLGVPSLLPNEFFSEPQSTQFVQFRG